MTDTSTDAVIGLLDGYVELLESGVEPLSVAADMRELAFALRRRRSGVPDDAA